MFYKDGDFNINQSWQITDLLKEKNNNENENNNIVSKNLDKFKRHNSKEKTDVTPDILDNELAKRIICDLQYEGAFKKKDNPILKPKLPPTTNISKPTTKQTATPKTDSDKITNSPSVPVNVRQKDADVVSMMAQRLTKLEMTCNSQRKELEEKNAEVRSLKEDVAVLKLAGNADEVMKYKVTIIVEFNEKSENEKLKKQVVEMEKFLNDYGLKWVGTTAAEQNKKDFKMEAVNKDITDARPIFRSNLPSEINMVIIEKRIEELNIVAIQDGEHEIVKEQGVNKFKKRDPLPIAFFKDGLMIKGFPFYKYTSKESGQILEDILDGYFPAVLKHKFPEGTLFKLYNKVDEDFKVASTKPFFNEFGNVDNFKPETREELLNKLPKQVIGKNGKIIPVRDEVAKNFEKFDPKSVGNKDSSKCDLEGEVAITTDTEKKYMSNQLSQEQLTQVISLKIRTETGKRTLLFKVLFSEKISAIYDIIKSYSETKNYEIWGSYPPRAYKASENLTLEELEITEDSTFNLRTVA